MILTTQRDKAGSAYIDTEFYSWTKNTFGDVFENLPKEKTGSGSQFMRNWESVKKAFNGTDLNKKHEIVFPALGAALRKLNIESPSYDSDDSSVVITG